MRRRTKFDWARDQKLSDKCAIVLRELVARDGPNGAYPSQTRLAFEANGMSIASVKRCLQDLEKLGLIKRSKFRGQRKGAEPNQFLSCRYELQYDVTVPRRPKGMSWKKFVASHEAPEVVPLPDCPLTTATTADSRRSFVAKVLKGYTNGVGRHVD